MNAVAEAPSSPLSFQQRVIGMFTSPVRVFESLRTNPAWIGMLLLFVIGGCISYLPMHKTIQREAVNEMLESIDGNDQIPAERKEEIIDRQKAFMEGPGFMAIALGAAIIFSPLMLLLWAFFIWLLYAFAAGGNLTYKQAFSAACHLSILFLAAGLLKIPMVLAKGSAHVATSLALISPDSDPKSVIYAFLDCFDIFSIAFLAVLGAGMVKLAQVSPSRSRMMVILLFVILVCFRVGGAMIGAMFSHMGRG